MHEDRNLGQEICKHLQSLYTSNDPSIFCWVFLALMTTAFSCYVLHPHLLEGCSCRPIDSTSWPHPWPCRVTYYGLRTKLNSQPAQIKDHCFRWHTYSQGILGITGQKHGGKQQALNSTLEIPASVPEVSFPRHSWRKKTDSVHTLAYF